MSTIVLFYFILDRSEVLRPNPELNYTCSERVIRGFKSNQLILFPPLPFPSLPFEACVSGACHPFPVLVLPVLVMARSSMAFATLCLTEAQSPSPSQSQEDSLVSLFARTFLSSGGWSTTSVLEEEPTAAAAAAAASQGKLTRDGGRADDAPQRRKNDVRLDAALARLRRAEGGAAEQAARAHGVFDEGRAVWGGEEGDGVPWGCEPRFLAAVRTIDWESGNTRNGTWLQPQVTQRYQ